MNKQRPVKVKIGNKERFTYSKIDDILEMPSLIEVQHKSFEQFIKKGIGEVFADFTPFRDFTGKIELHFVDYKFEGAPKYSEKECRDRDATFSRPLKVKFRLENKETGNILEQDVFMGDFPMMTANGSFIVNGAERVVISQLVRSPGVYCEKEKDKNGVDRIRTTLIPSRGAWLEFEEDISGSLSVRVDRNRKVTSTVLLKCLGLGSDEDIEKLFDFDPMIKLTLSKDSAKTEEEALTDLNKKLRPGEIPNVANIKNNINTMFFDARRYDLARVGRYKYNKKLSIASRIEGFRAASNIISEDGVLLCKEGELISEQIAKNIENLGINRVTIKVGNDEAHTVMSNNMIDIKNVIDCDPSSLGINEKVHYPTLKKLMAEANSEEELFALIKSNTATLMPRHVIVDDIIAAVNCCIGLKHGVGAFDNIDHLGNRRVRSVGELLQNQLRLGVARLERVIREKIQIQDNAEITPQSLINIRPVSSAIKEFFGSSQLSQFMDQSNPIAELTHKRKLSALGPGGLNRDRASFDVRDVHYTHYGRMCPIETPEGQNVGLISSLTTFARINEYGFIEVPYRRVDQKNKVVTKEVVYLTADEEDKYVIGQVNSPLDQNDWFEKEFVQARKREEIVEIEREQIDFMDVSPKQLVSVATALIPFLENDDTSRALMGSNMQRQAVPLLKAEAPIIGTGIEHKVAYDSGVMIIARRGGMVDYVSADEIIIKTESGERDVYTLSKFRRSNQGTCINQRPIVKKGQMVLRGAVLADGPSTENGELALGKNILIGFMSWEGYNYEDAILINESLVRDDVFTSIHIEEHEIEARDTKLGPEEITRDIPNIPLDSLAELDENGIIRVGAEVRSGDILVGKVTPKGETELTPEERLLRAIFGEKVREVRDTSLRVPHGEGGIVVDVKTFTRENRDELDPGVNKMVCVYIAQKRKISVGDKMAGRHGNKGVISRILPQEDMPFLADGTPLQIVLNPLGVPSRMNIGQVLETHLGLVAKAIGLEIATPVFDGASEMDIQEILTQNGYPEDGKIELFDGRTGEPFENKVTVGYMYMLKLVHLVDDKIHARSTGPYSLVTQQPLGGKAQFGGQRFGEMEVWALYAYGAANILQEIMTVKSDDIVGRVKTYESIVKGLNLSEPNVPESFKVLIKELQSLALDVKVLSDDNTEIGISDLIEDERDNTDWVKRKAPLLSFNENDNIDLADSALFDTVDDEMDDDDFEIDAFDLADSLKIEDELGDDDDIDF